MSVLCIDTLNGAFDIINYFQRMISYKLYYFKFIFNILTRFYTIIGMMIKPEKYVKF